MEKPEGSGIPYKCPARVLVSGATAPWEPLVGNSKEAKKQRSKLAAVTSGLGDRAGCSQGLRTAAGSFHDGAFWVQAPNLLFRHWPPGLHAHRQLPH